MIPARFAPILFGLILSGLMSLIVSCIATLRAAPLDNVFFGLWMGSWLSAWLIAFPAVLIVGPVTRKLVARLTS